MYYFYFHITFCAAWADHNRTAVFTNNPCDCCAIRNFAFSMVLVMPNGI